MTGRKMLTKVSVMLIATIVFLLTQTGVLAAQTPQFRLDIDTLNLQVGVSTNLVVSMINADGAEIADISGIENFDLVTSSNSTSTEIINGSTTTQEDVSYVIMPKKTGKYVLKGSIKYFGKTYQTNELQVNVTEADNSEKSEAKDLFIKTLLSDSEVYLGQKVILAYELYTSKNIKSYGFLDNTAVKDFITKDVPQDNLKSEITYVDGNKYAKYEAKQTFISPIKTGSFTIPAYNFQVNLSADGFFGFAQPAYLQTESKVLKVKPLPSANKPADFSGVVGDLTLESKYSGNEVNYGESLTLQVTASGDCNLDGLKEIVKGELPGFSVYQTEKNAEENIENNQYKAKKEFEIILVPRGGGDIKIEPMYVSYFNPSTGAYEKAEIPGTTIKVKGAAPKVQTDPGQTGGDTVIPVTETVKIEQVSYKPQSEGYFTIQMKREYLYIGLAAIAALLILAVIILLIFANSGKHDKRLQDIYKQLKKADNENEIYNLFNSMIKYRFDLSLKACSREMISNRLADSRYAASIIEVMDYMENGKYAADKGNINLKTKIGDIYIDISK